MGTLKLKTNSIQADTRLGVIDINQIEDGTVFSVEFFPPNQDKESFEKAEFANFINIADVDNLNPDFMHFNNHPKWSHNKYYEMKDLAITNLFCLLATIENLEDFKDKPIYETLRVIRNKYNDDYCTVCGMPLDDDTRRQNEFEQTLCEDCLLDRQVEWLHDRIRNAHMED